MHLARLDICKSIGNSTEREVFSRPAPTRFLLNLLISHNPMFARFKAASSQTYAQTSSPPITPPLRLKGLGARVLIAPRSCRSRTKLAAGPCSMCQQSTSDDLSRWLTQRLRLSLPAQRCRSERAYSAVTAFFTPQPPPHANDSKTISQHSSGRGHRSDSF